jgi:hypothetical protein
MATYVINAASSSPGSPWGTESTGAQTFKQLLDDITQADGDIIEVYDNAEIDDSAAKIPNITKDVTIRSYSENTGKPTVKIINNDVGFQFSAAGVSGNPKIHQIKMYKAGPSASGAFVKFNAGSFSSPEITENEMWASNTTSRGSSLVGVLIEVSTATFSGQLKIERNEIYDVWNCIQTNNGGGG